MNFLHLEESLSLDELIVLYEASIDRQVKMMKTMAAAAGATFENDESMIRYLYSDQNDEEPERKYLPSHAIDPSVGGEITPVYSQEEIDKLPINLGYSIINSETD